MFGAERVDWFGLGARFGSLAEEVLTDAAPFADVASSLTTADATAPLDADNNR